MESGTNFEGHAQAVALVADGGGGVLADSLGGKFRVQVVVAGVVAAAQNDCLRIEGFLTGVLVLCLDALDNAMLGDEFGGGSVQVAESPPGTRERAGCAEAYSS